MCPCSAEEYFYKLDSMIIRSTQYLRQVFKQRWKFESGEDWRDQPDYIQNFLSQHGEHILQKAIPLQKKILLASCSSDEWDISLMSLILLNFGDWKKYCSQNRAVRQLKDLRNDLAHHNSKRLTKSEYCEKVKMFKQSLEILEIKKSEIAKLVKGSSVNSSLEDTQRLNMLLENAEKLTKIQDFESALNQYSEAITIPRLSPENLGKVYEKRAACYLSISDKHCLEGKHTDQAILDVEQAMKLNKSSWNALYLKAQCHKAKNNLPEAIRFYEKAMAMSPLQKHIKQDLDSCKLLDWTQKHNANLNRDELPTSPNEYLEATTGRKTDDLRFSKLDASKTSPAVFGDYFYYGWDVPQDFAKAVKYYDIATKQGSASGCHGLALCYYYGHGVEQDMPKSIEIFKQCAKLDARTKERAEGFTPLGFNKHIAMAETDLGKCYEEGTGVEKNLAEAGNWYLKGTEHGHGDAATQLGFLFNKLERNKKWAEMYWKQGLILKSAGSAAHLTFHYFLQFKPKLSRMMFQIAREMGHSKCLEMSVEEFNQNIELIQQVSCNVDEEVPTFENNPLVELSNGLEGVYEQKMHLLSPVRKGLTLQHRERYRETVRLNRNCLPFDDELDLGKLQQKRASKISHLRSITLEEMNPTKDQIFKNGILDLTVIDEPIIYLNSIQLLAEDDNGDTTRVYIDHDGSDKQFWQRFEVGCRFAVVNPYMWICIRKDINAIRVNERKCIMYLENAKDMCRFCGEENAIRKCSKCKRLYCSRECQKLDWHVFEHKLICSLVC